ncbi:hypothetical protein, partial [Aeromonas media]|uniref:hypothetical protein n=1 Tax=Aeromonas media TaxID=651 RepID=UPI001F301FEC
FDAVSAHTDCLIQIVKERHAYRVEEAHLTLLTSKVKPYFQRLFEVIDLVVCVAACPVDGGAL